jgi:uncharacterized protein YbaA (DUF1428 family)
MGADVQEMVVFSWMCWPSRAVRDSGLAKIMADPRVHPFQNDMPFDGKRMIFYGFEVIVKE